MSNADPAPDSSDSPQPPRSLLGRLFSFSLGAVLLWLIWTWEPKVKDVAESLAALPDIVTVEQLAALKPGDAFLLEGTVHPVGPVIREYAERFAFQQTEVRKDSDGVGSSSKRVTIDQSLPAVELRWSGGSLVAPAESYDLRYAPKAPRTGWLKTTQKNTGFKPGDTATAQGTINADGVPRIERLAAAPRSAYLKRLERAERSRSFASYFLRAFISLFPLAMISALWKGGKPQRN